MKGVDLIKIKEGFSANKKKSPKIVAEMIKFLCIKEKITPSIKYGLIHIHKICCGIRTEPRLWGGRVVSKLQTFYSSCG